LPAYPGIFSRTGPLTLPLIAQNTLHSRMVSLHIFRPKPNHILYHIQPGTGSGRGLE
jgi:hypothetical protein